MKHLGCGRRRRSVDNWGSRKTMPSALRHLANSCWRCQRESLGEELLEPLPAWPVRKLRLSPRGRSGEKVTLRHIFGDNCHRPISIRLAKTQTLRCRKKILQGCCDQATQAITKKKMWVISISGRGGCRGGSRGAAKGIPQNKWPGWKRLLATEVVGTKSVRSNPEFWAWIARGV